MELMMVMNISKDSVQETCGGCPTIYEWKDLSGKDYYFRLRHGRWRICEDSTDELIVSGETDDGNDGMCNFYDVKRYAYNEGLMINQC